MKIELIPLHTLKPYGRNAKKHPEYQLQKIEDSIREFGFNQPLVVDKNNVIIVGHGRYEAAASLGIENVPCVVIDKLTSAQMKAYRLIDNRIAQTGWDYDLLKVDIEELKEEYNIELLGFNANELTDILYGKDLPSMEEGEAAEVKPKGKIYCPNCSYEFVP
jgi:ParB family chromosome partitioning protein